MAGIISSALFAVEVPPGDVLIDATADRPGESFRITMAAIDPSESPFIPEGSNGTPPMRATLKLLRQEVDEEEESEYLKALLSGEMSDEDDETSDEESDEEDLGGPSDLGKSKAAQQKALIAKLNAEPDLDDDEDEEDSDDENLDKIPNGINGFAHKSKKSKGKGKATGAESDSDSDGDSVEFDRFVLCTLDPEKAYQQPLDITVTARERIFFQVAGTHTIYLTGNYIDVDDHGAIGYDEDEDEDYDLSPDEDELDESEESDELDDLDDPRIMEVDSDEEVAIPKLVTTKSVAKSDADKKVGDDSKKGKNKRAAEDSENETTLDDLIAESAKAKEEGVNTKGLSKKQLKKLKNNEGKAVPAAEPTKTSQKSTESPASTTSKTDKKVQFAKNLEQGPTNSNKKPSSKEAESKSKQSDGSKADGEPKSALGVKMVQGVKIDDKKLGTGKTVKKGDKVSMRYIGKLADGRVFDANKKGPPFSCKIGAGEVIKGWDIGVLGMSVPGERRITIPSHLAYGNQAKPGIPANSQLTFEIKLLSVQ